MRTSPATKGLLARFLRWSARLPQPQRPAPRIRSRGAARVRARRQRRNLRRVSLLSKGLSCPLSVLTQCLDTEINSYRDSFARVPSYLRSSGSVGRPAGAAVMTTCAGDRKVEIYDMFHTSGVYMPATAYTCLPQVSLRWRMTRTFNIIMFIFRRKVETSTHERDEFPRQRPLGQLIQTIMLTQGACPPESCWVAERASCGLQGQHGFHCNYNCCV